MVRRVMSTTQALVHSINDAAALLGVSRSTVYRMIDAGQLEAVRVGHRQKILRASIDRLLEKATA